MYTHGLCACRCVHTLKSRALACQCAHFPPPHPLLPMQTFLHLTMIFLRKTNFGCSHPFFLYIHSTSLSVSVCFLVSKQCTRGCRSVSQSPLSPGCMYAVPLTASSLGTGASNITESLCNPSFWGSLEHQVTLSEVSVLLHSKGFMIVILVAGFFCCVS